MGCQGCGAEWQMRVNANRKFCASCRRKRGKRPRKVCLLDRGKVPSRCLRPPPRLNERQILTARGGKWHPTSVKRLLERSDCR